MDRGVLGNSLSGWNGSAMTVFSDSANILEDVEFKIDDIDEFMLLSFNDSINSLNESSTVVPIGGKYVVRLLLLFLL